jgi:HSP20 family protein
MKGCLMRILKEVAAEFPLTPEGVARDAASPFSFEGRGRRSTCRTGLPGCFWGIGATAPIARRRVLRHVVRRKKRRTEMKSIIRRDQAGEVSRERRQWDPFDLMREMLRWDPFRDVESLSRPGTWVPAFEVKEANDAFVFKADVPGLKEEDLEISLTGNRLTVSGKRDDERRDENERYFAYERSYGTFTRTFTLPDGVDSDHVGAELKDGVLTLTLPKRPEIQPKKIQLKSGKGAKA